MPVDPFNAAGIALGAASLAIQLFDGCVKGIEFNTLSINYFGQIAHDYLHSGFTFLVDTVQMPERCAIRRLRLVLEFNRLLAWGKVAGLIEASAGAESSQGLSVSRMDVMAVLSEIRTILEAFADLNTEYNELKPQPEAENRVSRSMTITDEVSSLKLVYEKNRRKRRYPLGTNHVMEAVEGIRAVARNPKRITWRLVDEKHFDNLLGRLGKLIDSLRELVEDHQLRQLQELTREIHMQMVQVRGSVTELKQLMTATNSHSLVLSGSDKTQSDGFQLLYNLAKLKEINTSGIHADAVAALSIPIDCVVYERARNQSRMVAKYTSEGSGQKFVWVEWKSYTKELSRDGSGPLEMDISSTALEQSAQLASLLACPKLEDFHVPHCFGYFLEKDNRGRTSRLGWVFKIPDSEYGSHAPRSLHWLFSNVARPPLSDRVSIACKLTTSLMYLHSVNWLHKAIRSDNVVFYWDGTRPNLEQPILAGFEYARHDAHDISERPDPNPTWDIYRWPSIQGEAPAAVRSRKIFDIYSLGLVLMEILFWKPLATLLELPDLSTVTLSQSKGIREHLLGESQCLDNVLDIGGRKYHGVVRRCLEGYLNDEAGHSGLGIKVDDNESDVYTSILLQERYVEHVVQELKGIQV
ncbi:hypothetical protein BHE90_008811 [Fusarium euwallaceae]|uniref:Prion-inhibition and propagation HeLo domain-containing protein n=1 Tax=Fusarium euwallaceae TaxID=1147111 RepID=A0A430LLZ4_9HYPO|nr:hypothetical protein BHE90_008811 [Fusarium euwallaceae]